MQAGQGKEFLDLVQRLPSEVRRSHQFGFGLLHKLADVVDPAVLQAVCRSDGQFEIVQPFLDEESLPRPAGRHGGTEPDYPAALLIPQPVEPRPVTLPPGAPRTIRKPDG